MKGKKNADTKSKDKKIKKLFLKRAWSDSMNI